MNNVEPLHKRERVLELELKSLDDKGMFEGYGSVFGNKDSYNEVVVKGAFEESLKKNKPESVKLLWQHNTTEPIGVYIDIHEDAKGLYVKGQLLIDDIVRAREAYALMKAGAINGLSIGFIPNPGGSETAKNGVTYLKSVSLWEVSIVTFPANTKAVVSNIKEHIMENKNTIRDFETFLRDSGKFSNSEAVTIASLADVIAGHPYIKQLQRDAEGNEDMEAQQKFSADILKIMTALEKGVKSL